MKITNYSLAISANKLREFRTLYNLRQSDMAEILGLEASDRICHWEKGRAVPGLINAIRLCVLFDTDLKSLYPDLYKQIAEEIPLKHLENYIKSI